MRTTVRTPQGGPRISEHRLDGVVVLRLTGGLDRALVDEVRKRAITARAPVIVDVDECVLVDPAPVQHLAMDWELYRPDMCIVTGCPGCREFLARAGIEEHLAVFERTDDAIDVRRSTGNRWSPDRSSE